MGTKFSIKLGWSSYKIASIFKSVFTAIKRRKASLVDINLKQKHFQNSIHLNCLIHLLIFKFTKNIRILFSYDFGFHSSDRLQKAKVIFYFTKLRILFHFVRPGGFKTITIYHTILQFTISSYSPWTGKVCLQNHHHNDYS